MTRWLVLLACIAVSLTARADLAGVSAGAGLWHQDPGGNISFQGDDIDLDDDLSLGGETHATGWIALEHPVPLLPNAKLRYTRSHFGGRGRVESSSITFGDAVFAVGDDIDTDIDLDQFDLALYYEVLDDGLNLDLGLALKYFQGEFDLRSSTQREQQDLTGVVPMLYANAHIDLPFTGLYLGAEGQGIAVGNNQVLDWQARIGYRIAIGVGAEVAAGVEAGYRGQKIQADDITRVDTNIDVDGAFAHAYVQAGLF